MSTEAQKKASRNYYLKHKDYYFKKSKESIKQIRMYKRIYEDRINKAIEYIDNSDILDIHHKNRHIFWQLYNCNKRIRTKNDYFFYIQEYENVQKMCYGRFWGRFMRKRLLDGLWI